jgi:hypothetical protein
MNGYRQDDQGLISSRGSTTRPWVLQLLISKNETKEWYLMTFWRFNKFAAGT